MIAGAIVVVLLVLIILSLPFLLDLNRYRDHYLPILEQVLHRNVEVEDVQLTLFPKLGVQLQDVVIADDPAFSSKPFLRAPSVQVAVQWRPLLQRRIQVERVLVEDPVVQIIRSTKGDLNTATIGKIPSHNTAPSDMAEPKGSVSPLLGVLAVKQFSSTGGTLQIEDRTNELPKAYQIDNLALNTESVAIGKTARVRVHGMLTPYQMPFDVTGRLGPLQPNLDIPMLEVDGLLGKVAVTAKGKIIDGQLEVDIQIPKVSTDDVPIDLGLKKRVGLSQLQAHFAVSIFPRESRSLPDEIVIDPLRLNLHIGQSTIHVSGKGTPSRFSLTGDAATFNSDDFPVVLSVQQPFVLEQLEFSAEVQGDTLHLQSFKTKAFDGAVIAQGVLDGLSPPLTFSTQGAFKNFSAEALLNVMRPSSLTLTGVGRLEWKVSGVVSPSRSPKLDGHTHLTLWNGKLIGFDLVKTIEDALHLSGVLGESTGTTQYSVIDAKTELGKSGLAIRDLTAKAPNFSSRSVGKVDFDQSVNLQGTLSVPRSMADTIIQRFPMANVVRHEGQLVLPLVVRGTVQNPKLRLDTQSLGNQVKKKIEKRIEKVLRGDDQELKNLLNEGKDLLKHLFRK